MEWGPFLEKLAGPISRGECVFWNEQPVVLAQDRWLLGAFRDLNTCRTVGVRDGLIPWTAIDAYARRYRIVGEDFETLAAVIRHMDLCWMEFHNERSAKEEEPEPEDDAS
jgi:hypothetical protein